MRCSDRKIRNVVPKQATPMFKIHKRTAMRHTSIRHSLSAVKVGHVREPSKSYTNPRSVSRSANKNKALTCFISSSSTLPIFIICRSVMSTKMTPICVGGSEKIQNGTKLHESDKRQNAPIVRSKIGMDPEVPKTPPEKYLRRAQECGLYGKVNDKTAELSLVRPVRLDPREQVIVVAIRIETGSEILKKTRIVEI